MKYFDLEFETPKSPSAVQREVLQTWTSQLAACGYELTSQTDVGITYSRKYRRWFIILLAVLTFPIGLLFLLAADTATITAVIEPDDDGTGSALVVNGKAPKNVRQGLEALEV